MDASWRSLHQILAQLFHNMNTQNSLLTPEEVWRTYHRELQVLLDADRSEITDALVEVSPDIWIPKAYEAIRLLKNLRQRFDRQQIGTDLVAQARAEVIRRDRPVWDVGLDRLSEFPDLRAIAELGGKETYSRFQVRGWEIVLKTIENQESMIITAPTGSGKTEVFLLPLIYWVTQQVYNHRNPRFILIYPRVELLKDQLSRILKYVYQSERMFRADTKNLFGKKLSPVITGLQFGGIRTEFSDTKNNPDVFVNNVFQIVPECPICNSGQLILASNTHSELVCSSCSARFNLTLSKKDHEEKKPHLLVTTVESLDRLYLNPRLESYLSDIHGMVFDEIHLFNSLYGAHLHHLIKRIESRQKHQKIAKIGASATVSQPEKFASKLFYGNDDDSRVYKHDASYARFPKESSGLEIVLFLQTDINNYPLTQSTLIQTAMAVGHGVLGQEDRTIIFTESIDHAKRTQIMLDDAERRRELWRFRVERENIFFNQFGCPATDPLECQAIYHEGECWRGLRGGLTCAAPLSNLVETDLGLNLITSIDRNNYWNGNVVIATPALEVGVDDENFRATIHYRPPRSVFSFLQRRGRAGRRLGDMAYTIMVLGRTPMDEFYFRRRNRLMDAGQFELPLNPDNAVVKRMHNDLESEVQSIGKYIEKYTDLRKSALIWAIDKFLACHLIKFLFGNVLENQRGEALSDIQSAQRRFSTWVGEQRVKFEDHLNMILLLYELTQNVPEEEKGKVHQFRQAVADFRMGIVTDFEVLIQLATELESILKRLKYDALRELNAGIRTEDDYDFTKSLCERLQQRINSVLESPVRLSNLGVAENQVSGLYDFFSHLDRSINGEKRYPVINDIPSLIKIVMQSLFYIRPACEDTCSSCVDYFMPSAYFQEVKPISVETTTTNQISPNKANGRFDTQLFAEDSTKLSYMLIPYKPFYRYFNDADKMGILDTEHSPDWVKKNPAGITEVRLELRVEGVRYDGMGVVPNKLYVRPISTDSAGQGIVKLCESCYALYNEKSKKCPACKADLIPVRIRSEPLVQRAANYDNTTLFPISKTFSYCQDMEGITHIRGAEVEYVKQRQTGSGYVKIGSPKNFMAIYSKSGENNEPIVYRLNTRGIIWDLNRAIHNIMRREDLRHTLQALNPPKVLSPHLILHTAAHMLHKAIAFLSGVNDYVLEYAIDEEGNKVIVWERYEGGVGISEVVKDVIWNYPINFYRELLASVLCPVFYSEQFQEGFEPRQQLREHFCSTWGLDIDDTLIESVIGEVLAEQTALQYQRAEGIACTVSDGCPACIHTTICTGHLEQPILVSRYVGEALMQEFVKQVNPIQFERINEQRIVDGISESKRLPYNTNEDNFEILDF